MRGGLAHIDVEQGAEKFFGTLLAPRRQGYTSRFGMQRPGFVVRDVECHLLAGAGGRGRDRLGARGDGFVPVYVTTHHRDVETHREGEDDHHRDPDGEMTWDHFSAAWSLPRTSAMPAATAPVIRSW